MDLSLEYRMMNDECDIGATCFDSTESSSGPRVLDLYKECTTHCGIPNAYNNRSEVQKYSTQYRIYVNGTIYVK